MRAWRRVPPFIHRMMSEDANKRSNQASGPQVKTTGKIGGDFQVAPNAEFLQDRLNLYTELYSKYLNYLSQKPKEPISITLPDGAKKEGVSWETSPFEVARSISKKLAESCLVAKVRYSRRVGAEEGLISADEHEEESKEETGDFEMWDMKRPLEGDCELHLLKFEDPEGKVTFWHSSAHVLGASLEKNYGAHLCIGPPLNPGFFYDAYMGTHSLSQENFSEIQKAASEIIQAKQSFERIVLSKEEALELFKYNPFKVQLITNKIPEGGKTTAYRCGNLIDLCTGPHLPDTGKIKAFAVTKNSSSYWLGKAENDSLQRVYGVSFPSKKELSEYIRLQEEAEKRDHRRVGTHQELFFWHTHSPGSTFFLPYGSRIYNKLVDFVREEYKFRGFTEVVSPNVYSSSLWKTSGHYQKYKDDMFMFEVEKQEFGMKPMNCPGHCLIFDHAQRSYKELPLRFAEFGVLHRNELSGTLSGLTRVRRFVQDDAHIFCRKDQISEEVIAALDFLTYIYDVLGFKYEFELSTRPESALGPEPLWRLAEAQLAEALDQTGHKWKLNPGDGAFYGPKIDIKVYDALKRKHQCGTVQLDFNLPIRFNLQYRAEKDSSEEFKPVEYDDGYVEKPCKPGFERPVMIHRAILGSIERMFAIMVEQTGGKWPFWLSPRQMIICPISEHFINYAELIKNRLWMEGFYVEVDESNLSLNKKIRNAQLAQFNYIGVVGEQEMASSSIDIRDRDSNRSLGKFTVEKLVEHFKSLYPEPSKAKLSMKSKAFYEDIVTIQKSINLKDLNQELELKTYLSGDSASEEDWSVYKAMLQEPDSEKYPHLLRWYRHLTSLVNK